MGLLFARIKIILTLLSCPLFCLIIPLIIFSVLHFKYEKSRNEARDYNIKNKYYKDFCYIINVSEISFRDDKFVFEWEAQLNNITFSLSNTENEKIIAEDKFKLLKESIGNLPINCYRNYNYTEISLTDKSKETSFVEEGSEEVIILLYFMFFIFPCVFAAIEVLRVSYHEIKTKQNKIIYPIEENNV